MGYDWVMSEPPPLDPETLHDLELLAAAIAQREDHADLARRFEYLVDTLIFRGQLPESFRRVLKKISDKRSLVRLATFRDKYQVESADIDCASRIPLCKARCCSMEVTLSAQDVVEGGIPFQITEPYAMPRDAATKQCVCMDAAGACTIYDKRPGACRAYDCRNDPRVWIDFEARIATPLPE
ncbi:MAG TPA: YkgJ family cysteine cluster protein [Kofleriaceae bacterium]|nr:YkgJ family cysteine cluster protein [Kofleriaceae bacterium]